MKGPVVQPLGRQAPLIMSYPQGWIDDDQREQRDTELMEAWEEFGSYCLDVERDEPEEHPWGEHVHIWDTEGQCISCGKGDE